MTPILESGADLALPPTIGALHCRSRWSRSPLSHRLPSLGEALVDPRDVGASLRYPLSWRDVEEV